MKRILLVAAWLALISNRAGATQSYKAIDLYTISAPDGFLVQGGGAGQLVGWGYNSVTYDNTGALLWTGNGQAINLNPSGFAHSIASGTNGTQQVGYGIPDQSFGAPHHALLWSGKKSSAIDLNPTSIVSVGESELVGVYGVEQVGNIYGFGGLHHAALWHGAADSAVDLHPANFGFLESYAVGTDGVEQVGYSGLYDGFQALLWSGTAASAVDLNPTNLGGIDRSIASGVSGSQQVGRGWASVGGYMPHALLWSGSADSAVDLNPTNLSGFESSSASGTNGARQVGTGASLSLGEHALLWAGTSDSAVDLHLLLPAGFGVSAAYSIDARGNVFGIAIDAVGKTHAVEWVPVPEPSSAVLAALGLVGLAIYRGRMIR